MIRCIAFILVFILGGYIASAEQNMGIEAFVWNNESFRVPLYTSADLCPSNRFGSYYLLNGCSVRILEHQAEEHSVHISFLNDTYWVDANHIVFVAPPSPLTISRAIIEDTAIIPQTETVISEGALVEIVGYVGSAVFVYWENEYRAISPAAFKMFEISYDSPDYLTSKAEVISVCLQHLKETYNISDDNALKMHQEFLHYFTFGSPALYLIHFYTETGAVYSYHFDGEHNIILYSSFSPYAVG